MQKTARLAQNAPKPLHQDAVETMSLPSSRVRLRSPTRSLHTRHRSRIGTCRPCLRLATPRLWILDDSPLLPSRT